MSEDRYVYATDEHGENFVGEFSTRAAARDEAIEHARLRGWTKIATGRALRCDPYSFLPSVDDILDLMSGAASGEVGGDHAEDWPDVGPEGRVAFDKMIADWVDKYVDEPRFFTVEELEEETLP